MIALNTLPWGRRWAPNSLKKYVITLLCHRLFCQRNCKSHTFVVVYYHAKLCCRQSCYELQLCCQSLIALNLIKSFFIWMEIFFIFFGFFMNTVTHCSHWKRNSGIGTKGTVSMTTNQRTDIPQSFKIRAENWNFWQIWQILLF